MFLSNHLLLLTPDECLLTVIFTHQPPSCWVDSPCIHFCFNFSIAANCPWQQWPRESVPAAKISCLYAHLKARDTTRLVRCTMLTLFSDQFCSGYSVQFRLGRLYTRRNCKQCLCNNLFLCLGGGQTICIFGRLQAFEWLLTFVPKKANVDRFDCNKVFYSLSLLFISFFTCRVDPAYRQAHGRWSTGQK